SVKSLIDTIIDNYDWNCYKHSVDGIHLVIFLTNIFGIIPGKSVSHLINQHNIFEAVNSMFFSVANISSINVNDLQLVIDSILDFYVVTASQKLFIESISSAELLKFLMVNVSSVMKHFN
ncbi:MAG: hypothetical protein MHPSP_000250, partial [Paramarteilia canceri]